MKKHLILSVLCCTFLCAHAQIDYSVLDWDPHTTLYNYVTEEMHRQYMHRDSMLTKAIQQNKLGQYQNACRKRYQNILGNLPESAPLNAKITGVTNRGEYIIKKIIYESFPNHHVTADLYVPDGKGPFPGILFFCGHEPTAKATITYQQTAIRFAKNGFVVLAIDPISQGERYQFTDDKGQPLTRGGTTGHTLLASGSNLVGTSVVAYQFWDNKRGLDYLSSLSMVDTNRLGCLGNSGGGTQTAYFIPLDPRIKVAAIASYVTRRERTLLLLGPQDGCQWLPGESKAGLDISDYLIMFAPKPMLVLAGRYGFVDYNGTKDVYRELKQVYKCLNHPEKISLFSADDGHGIQKSKQIAAVNWFRHWLYQDSTPINDRTIEVFTEKELDATNSGQVNTAFEKEQTIQANNLITANRWKKKRSELLKGKDRKEYKKIIRRVLQIQPDKSPINVQQMGSFIKQGYQFTKLILRKKGQPPLPCLLGFPQKQFTSHKLVIGLSQKGKQAILNNDSLIKAHRRNNDIMLLADLRGMGETADPSAKNPKKYYNHEYRVAMLSLFIGKPLPGQRTQDILTLIDYCKFKSRLKNLSIEIVASGAAAEAALFAAALDERITHIQLYQTLRSFYKYLKHPLAKDQYSYTVPGVLKFYDLPDLVKFIGENKVTIR